MKINTENWTYTHFQSPPLRAFISLGAAPAENEEGVIVQYLVTLTDKDYQELYQSTHENLNEALTVLNEKYGDWELLDAEKKSDGDGCSSCAAH